jgi:hypothetical protein
MKNHLHRNLKIEKIEEMKIKASAEDELNGQQIGKLIKMLRHLRSSLT